MKPNYSEFEYVFDGGKFASDVMEWRIRKGLSRQDFAQVIDLDHSPNFVGLIEANGLAAGVTMRTFVRICRVIDKSPLSYFAFQRYVVT